MWKIVITVAALAIIAAVIINDYSNYLDLQRRLKAERERKKRVT